MGCKTTRKESFISLVDKLVEEYYIENMNATDDLIKRIGEVVDEKVATQLEPIKKRLDSIDSRLDNVDARLDKVDTRIDGFDQKLDGFDQKLDGFDHRLATLEKGQKSQGKSLKKLQKTLDVVITTFDRGDIQLHKRVQRIETHLGLPNFE